MQPELASKFDRVASPLTLAGMGSRVKETSVKLCSEAGFGIGLYRARFVLFSFTHLTLPLRLAIFDDSGELLRAGIILSGRWNEETAAVMAAALVKSDGGPLVLSMPGDGRQHKDLYAPGVKVCIDHLLSSGLLKLHPGRKTASAVAKAALRMLKKWRTERDVAPGDLPDVPLSSHRKDCDLPAASGEGGVEDELTEEQREFVSKISQLYSQQREACAKLLTMAAEEATRELLVLAGTGTGTGVHAKLLMDLGRNCMVRSL